MDLEDDAPECTEGFLAIAFDHPLPVILSHQSPVQSVDVLSVKASPKISDSPERFTHRWELLSHNNADDDDDDDAGVDARELYIIRYFQ